MKKSDLKNGCVVELRNGDKGIKIDNILLIVRENSKDIFSWLKLNDYNNNLTFPFKDLGEYDIVKVDNDVTFNYFNTEYCAKAIGYYSCRVSTKTDKWTWERKENILTDKEREYLKAVIEPIKDKINFIVKLEYIALQKQCIRIQLNEGCMELYPFDTNTQFINMELNKEYTLKELGLE